MTHHRRQRRPRNRNRARVPFHETAIASRAALDGGHALTSRNFEDCRRAEFRRKAGQSPPVCVEDTHAALAVDHDRQAGSVPARPYSRVQDLFRLPQQRVHLRLIGGRGLLFF